MVPREGEVMPANADASKFIMPGEEPRRRDVALRITTSFACGSHFVFRNVFAEHALVAFAVSSRDTAPWRAIGNSDLRVYRTGTERDAGLITVVTTFKAKWLLQRTRQVTSMGLR